MKLLTKTYGVNYFHNPCVHAILQDEYGFYYVETLSIYNNIYTVSKHYDYNSALLQFQRLNSSNISDEHLEKLEELMKSRNWMG